MTLVASGLGFRVLMAVVAWPVDRVEKEVAGEGNLHGACVAVAAAAADTLLVWWSTSLAPELRLTPWKTLRMLTVRCRGNSESVPQRLVS